MTEEEAAQLFREQAIEAGLPATMTPNDIAIALHEWLDSVPENPRDPLWREVSGLIDYDGSSDFYERRAHACRAALLRGQPPRH